MQWFKKKQKETFEEALSKIQTPGKLPLPQKLSDKDKGEEQNEELSWEIPLPRPPSHFNGDNCAITKNCAWLNNGCYGSRTNFCKDGNHYGFQYENLTKPEIYNTTGAITPISSIGREYRCPDCNSSKIIKTYGDRFKCLHCGKIFS
jgi:hypothetical protein